MKPIKGKKAGRLKNKEERLVSKGNRFVDEGRDERADNVLRRAAKAETRYHNYVEKKNSRNQRKTGK